ncbi:MAG: alpha/beta hydrolase-fold protein [Bacteroidota bacterium]
MKKHIFLFITFIISFNLVAQVTINVNSVPNTTPVTDDIFIAGSFNNWNPADANNKLIKNGTTYSIVLPAGSGNAEYKFTRGSWATVEGDANGNVIGNRKFTYSVNGVLNLTIAGWEDKKQGGGSNSTALPNVKIVSNSFFIPQLNKTRKIWIYLPNDYDSNTTKKYPVIYLHDGQNCFDNATSFAGEWGIDETLSNKQKNGDYGCIAVAIENGGGSRIDEYSPYINLQYGGGKGDEYLDFIVSTLKPFIDSAYRTKKDYLNTAIVGSSMGGLISSYAMLKYPNVFGKAGIFSPALWFSNSIFVDAINNNKTTNQKYYFVCGKNESTTMVKWQDSLNAVLISKGFINNVDVKNVVKPEGTHSEAFWKAEFGACYDWLFQNNNLQSKKNGKIDFNIEIYPNPSTHLLNLSCNCNINSVTIFDNSQKEIYYNKIEKNTQNIIINTTAFVNGIYIIQLNINNQIITKKITILNEF